MGFLDRILRNQKSTATPVPEIQTADSTLEHGSFQAWVDSQMKAESDWFLRIELPGGTVTPGWSDPRKDKLPHFGLPEDLSGMRVLDIGHAEGFFSFEAERRGAAEVISIDPDPQMNRKFNICRAALGSRAQSYICDVYDLDVKTFGTFDLVMFYGVLYHLRHPLLALQKVRDICSGTVLLQSVTYPDKSDVPLARFYPKGVPSGPPENPVIDVSCFWFPNPACMSAMLEHVGFMNVEEVSRESSIGAVFRAQAPAPAKGLPADLSKLPWS